MKKDRKNIKYYFLLLTGMGLLLMFCGCGGNHNEIPEADLIAYLENKYDESFTLTGKEEFSPHGKGTDTLYTFESNSGIVCHISKVFAGGFMGYRYSYRDDYPVMYLRCHPEFAGELEAVGAERGDEEENYCAASTYIIFIDRYDEIDSVTGWIEEFLQNAQPVPDSGYTVPQREIVQSCAGITIGFRENDYRFYSYCRYPTEARQEIPDREDFLAYAQGNYVRMVREGSLSEDLSDDLLEKYPAGAIRNITCGDEAVIDYMVYREERGGYSIELSCTEKEECEFYPDKLASLLRKLGWQEKVSKRSVTWSRGGDTVRLCLEGYGLNNTELHCYKNEAEYQVRGYLLWQEGTNPLVALSQPDLQYLFGMDFEFDQRNMTGRLVSY